MEEENELITYRLGSVSFDNFDEYVERAKAVAEVLNSTELTEDNVKEVKATLAGARKITDALNARRIEVKKAILEPYGTLESQVKLITGIIDEAESVLRTKVREMEQRERDDKETLLRGIWESRIGFYSFRDLIPDVDLFHAWLTPQHLNKTTTIAKAEKDMVEWMEQRDKDTCTLRVLPEDVRTLALEEYSHDLDLSRAISTAQARKTRMDTIRQETGDEPGTATFIVTGDKDIQLAELLFTTNKINYRRA